MNIKELSTEEIRNLIEELKNELKSREEKPRLVVYTHDCQNRARYHLNKYKHWCKLVNSIDLDKANGYAFIGPFLQITSENMVPIGSIIVEVCDSDYTAYRITGDNEKTVIAEASRGSLRGMIIAVAEALDPSEANINNE